MTRAVVLCADDFGLTPGVSRAILDLAERGRLSATSAMTTLPGWSGLAPRLSALRPGIGVGLHLNLTTGRPLGAMPRLAPGGALPPVGHLIRSSLLGGLSRGEVADEIERQLDAFEAVFGPPDFVDGHQHVHVLPVVRGALLAVLARRRFRGWLRDPAERLPAILLRSAAAKALVATALAASLHADAARRGLATNRGFSGFSAFPETATAVARTFEQAFAMLGPAPVVMCHPGKADAELAALDPVVAARPLEARYLASDAFARLLEERGLELAPRPPGA